MSDLETFRDHARHMATVKHKPECQGEVIRPWGPVRGRKMLGVREVGRDPDGVPMLAWTEHPDPACPGCVPDAERALWTQLADEADAFLNRHSDEVLFS